MLTTSTHIIYIHTHAHTHARAHTQMHTQLHRYCVLTEGAKEGGIAGFLTGTGKGVAGLFLRPIGGTFDLINVTFDHVKK